MRTLKWCHSPVRSSALKEQGLSYKRFCFRLKKRNEEKLAVKSVTLAKLKAYAHAGKYRLVYFDEAGFAALCGVNPLEASSGKKRRHRLKRGGSREANNALWTVALIRMRSHARTRQYTGKRTTEGLTTKEIQRCLKRYIARELFPIILSDLTKFRNMLT